jgi:hypothetical protein
MVKLITRTLKHNLSHGVLYFISQEYLELLNFVDAAFVDRSVTYHGENKEVLYIVEVVTEVMFDELQHAWSQTQQAESERWGTLGITYTETVQDVVDKK